MQIKTLEDLKTYKFDTSKYIILKDGINRDLQTGRLKVSQTELGGKHKIVC